MYPTSLAELFSLAGQVALVTGASGAIGQALARGLAVAGATVALTARSEGRLTALQQEILAAGGKAEVFPTDLGVYDNLAPLVDAVLARCGRIDILVNCAGVNQREPMLEVQPDTYDRIMALNLRHLYFLCQCVVRHMRKQGGGKIINIGSLTSTVGLADISVYGMTKSALAQLTKTLAVELAQDQIRVNCLCPGFIATELTVPLWESPVRSRWILERLPIKRAGTPEDLVGLVIYLASDAASYVTGQSIYVDGGFLAGSQW